MYTRLYKILRTPFFDCSMENRILNSFVVKNILIPKSKISVKQNNNSIIFNVSKFSVEMFFRNIQNFSYKITVKSLTQLNKIDSKRLNISSTDYKATKILPPTARKVTVKEISSKCNTLNAKVGEVTPTSTPPKTTANVPATKGVEKLEAKIDVGKTVIKELKNSKAAGATEKLVETKQKKDLTKSRIMTPELRDAKNVNVAIIGAGERAGQVLAFQLKQHPLIKKLYLHGENCRSLSEDLNQIDTSCTALGYNHEKQLHKCLRVSEIFIFSLLSALTRT